jgi:hypothetical protein
MNLSKVCARALETEAIVMGSRFDTRPRRPGEKRQVGIIEAYEELLTLVENTMRCDEEYGYRDGYDYATDHWPDEAYYRVIVARLRDWTLPEAVEKVLQEEYLDTAEISYEVLYRLGWLRAVAEEWGEIEETWEGSEEPAD